MREELKSYEENVAIPISCISVTSKGDLVIGGGGGPGRSGVKNKLIVGKVNQDLTKFERKTELEFLNSEDCPTCLDSHPKKTLVVTGVNESKEKILEGNNKSLRVYNITRKKINFVASAKISNSKDLGDYLKFVVFERGGKFLCTGSTDGNFRILNFPSLVERIKPLKSKEEVLGADFSSDSKMVSVITKSELIVINTKNGDIIQTIKGKSLGGSEESDSGAPANFRAVKFGRAKDKIGADVDMMYTVLNAKTRKKAYIVKWDTKKWTKIGSRMVSLSPITSFCVSKNGELLAVATNDNKIMILDSRTLIIKETIKNAHSFAITALAFDNESGCLVSGSADETFRVTKIPHQWPTLGEQVLAAALRGLGGGKGEKSAIIWAVIFILMAIMVGLFYRMYG